MRLKVHCMAVPMHAKLCSYDFFGQDIFFLGYFDCSDHVFNDGLVLEASDRTLHLVEIPKMTKNRPQNSLLGGL